MNLRFFALVHKYSLVLDPIRIEKVIFFSFFFGGGGEPLKFFAVFAHFLHFFEICAQFCIF